MPEIKHYQALFPKLPQLSNTLNGATTLKSNENISLDFKKRKTTIYKLII
jgi:hypothetical protein